MEGQPDTKEVAKVGDNKSYAGIPQAEFLDDVNAYMQDKEGADAVLRKLEEHHSKYKFMESNLLAKRKRLRAQIPDLKRSLLMIEKLQTQTEEFETEYLLSEQVFLKAVVPPTKTVCLWLGANVMLEYTLDDAKELLSNNMNTATKTLSCVEQDLDFLRDQFTTMEVNMARVFNWDVKRRQASKAAATAAGK